MFDQTAVHFRRGRASPFGRPERGKKPFWPIPLHSLLVYHALPGLSPPTRQKFDFVREICYNDGMMKIGNLTVGGFAALAPMAGVADRAMRELCIRFGAGYCVSELTSAKGVDLGDKKSAAFLACFPAERPIASQLFGCDPLILARAAEKAQEYGPDFLDLNMGCPAPKVALNGCGSALMKNPELAGKIVREVRRAVTLPVTAKIRIGWDENSVNAVEFARVLEEAGVDAITVHGRTRAQMYAPPVHSEVIRAVKEAVRVPVIANGDITDGASALKMLWQTGCDYLMVGRAAMGNPFIFREIEATFTGRPYTPPTKEERIAVMKEQILLMTRYKEERTAFLEARKHTAWYFRGFPGASEIRRACSTINGWEDIERICEKVLAELRNV